MATPVAEKSLLLFFTSKRCGPARRMESVLAHVARKERTRLRVIRVDVDEQAALAERFKIDQLPTLVLVRNGRPLGRIDGRASAPRIERLLRSGLESIQTPAP